MRSIWQAASLKPVAIRHAAGMLRDTAWLAFAFIAGVETIFLTDLIINRILPRVLENGASLLNVVVLTALFMPSSLYVALPIAVLSSVYFVVLRRREAREMIVFAGMGQGAGRVLVFAVTVGVLALALSLFVSGLVEPLARYQASRTMFDVRHEAVRTGAIGAGKFYEHEGFTVFAGSGRTSQVANQVFFLHDEGDDSYRIITASQSNRLRQSNVSDSGVILNSAATYDFDIVRTEAPETLPKADCPDCTGLSVAPRGARASRQILVDLPNITFPEREPRGSNAAERTSLELLDGELTDVASRTELGDRVFRALLVFIAPLLAILSVSLTTPAFLLLSLPAAAGVVLAGSFFGSRLVDLLLPLGTMGMLTGLVFGALALAGVLIALVFRFESGCIQHGGVQL